MIKITETRRYSITCSGCRLLRADSLQLPWPPTGWVVVISASELFDGPDDDDDHQTAAFHPERIRDAFCPACTLKLNTETAG